MLAVLCVCSSLGDQGNKNCIFVVYLYIFLNLCVHVHGGGGWVNVCICACVRVKIYFGRKKAFVDGARPSL